MSAESDDGSSGEYETDDEAEDGDDSDGEEDGMEGMDDQ